jgi:hypothetical protein
MTRFRLTHRSAALLVAIFIIAFVAPAVSAATLFAPAYSEAGRQLPDLPPISPELLASLYAGLLSLLLSYVPGLNTRWTALPEDTKKAIMGLGLILISGGVFAAGCAPALGIVFVECSSGGALRLISILIAALWTNQSVHRLSPQPAAVKAVRATQPH